jgi:hypothetical protein
MELFCPTRLEQITLLVESFQEHHEAGVETQVVAFEFSGYVETVFWLDRSEDMLY